MAMSGQHSTGDTQYGIAPRLLLASLGLAAGAIHLAMAPIHAGSSTTEALLFAGAGWAQILLAIAVIIWPSRTVFAGTLLVNAAIIGVYIMSRTVGVPFGDQPWDATSVSGIDLMTTMFESGIVAITGMLLVRPELGYRRDGGSALRFETLAASSALPVLVLFAASIGLADPGLAQHGGSGGAAALAGGDGHGGTTSANDPSLVALASNRCDLGFNPAAYWNDTTVAGIDTLMGGQAATLGHNATAGIQGSAELDKLIAQQNTSKGEIGDAMMVVSLSKASDDVYRNWLRWLGASNASHAEMNMAAPDDTGMGGHIGPQAWHAMTDKAQCDQLAAELALARDTALKYPTVADAKAAGWRQITGYVPGIAAHFMNFKLVDGVFNIEEPEMILYDGIDDDSRVVGLSYYLQHEGTGEPTQGFTGNNDHYHKHEGLCVNNSGVIGDSTTTEEDCKARGGTKADGTSGWMSHAWVVPGCESPWGVFSGVSPILDPELTKASGSDGGGCAGSGVRERFDLSPGEFGNTPTAVGGSVELAVGN